MSRTLSDSQIIEQSITKTYRERIWKPFLSAVRRYELISPGDRVAVCVSGGKDSMLMAKLIQLLIRYGDVPFEAVFLLMDPGYNEKNRQLIEQNAARFDIPLTVFSTDIFAISIKRLK